MSLEPRLRNPGLEDEGEPLWLWHLFFAYRGEVTTEVGVSQFWLCIQQAPAACMQYTAYPQGQHAWRSPGIPDGRALDQGDSPRGKVFLPPRPQFTRPRCLFLFSRGLWDEPTFLVSPKPPKSWVLVSQEWGTVSSDLPSMLPPKPVLENWFFQSGWSIGEHRQKLEIKQRTSTLVTGFKFQLFRMPDGWL